MLPPFSACPSQPLPLHWVLFAFCSLSDLSELQVGETSGRQAGRTGFHPSGRGGEEAEGVISACCLLQHLLPELLRSLIPMGRNQTFSIDVN